MVKCHRLVIIAVMSQENGILSISLKGKVVECVLCLIFSLCYLYASQIQAHIKFSIHTRNTIF